MKFKLKTSAYSYSREDARELEPLGFTFKERIDFMTGMKKLVQEKYESEIEINSLEELVNFSKQWGELVLNQDSIEIYNDYRE